MSQFSIIIPLFNSQNFIQRALKSCMKQTLEDIEILIIDDKSEDESLQIVLELAKKDKRIKIFQNDKNLGTFASRNLGVLKASSAFVMFLDSDDFLNLKACELALEKMKQGFDLICFDAYVHRVKTKKFYRFKQDEEFNKEGFLEFLLRQRHFCWSVWAKVYRKDIILKSFEFFDMNEKLCYGEDVLFNYVNFMLCERFFVSKECIYHYEFNELGRYENKNKEILLQNYLDKKRSFELIEKISSISNYNKFNQKLLGILRIEIEALNTRISYL